MGDTLGDTLACTIEMRLRIYDPNAIVFTIIKAFERYIYHASIEASCFEQTNHNATL